MKLYTDGACSGNPGPGGWGYVLRDGETERRESGFEEHTTNNRMELLAIIKGLSTLAGPSNITVVTDSRYVVDAYTKGWIDKWVRQGWRTAGGKPVKNRDLWRDLVVALEGHTIEWRWVKGHSGHIMNEECDRLAREAIARRTGT